MTLPACSIRAEVAFFRLFHTGTAILTIRPLQINVRGLGPKGEDEQVSRDRSTQRTPRLLRHFVRDFSIPSRPASTGLMS